MIRKNRIGTFIIAFSSFFILALMTGCSSSPEKTDTANASPAALQLDSSNEGLQKQIIDLKKKIDDLSAGNDEVSNRLVALQNRMDADTNAIKDLLTSRTKTAAKKAAPRLSADELKAGSFMFRDCEKLYGIDDFDKATACYEKFRAKMPAHPFNDRAAFRIAECYMGKKDLNGAMTEIEKLMMTYPYSFKIPDVLKLKALILLASGKEAESNEILSIIKSTYPGHPLNTAMVQIEKQPKTEKTVPIGQVEAPTAPSANTEQTQQAQ